MVGGLCEFILFSFSQNEILYEKKKKRRRLRLRRLGKRAPPTSPQDGQPMDDLEKEMRQVERNKWNFWDKYNSEIWLHGQRMIVYIRTGQYIEYISDIFEYQLM